jgi:hypothetical protein
MVLFPPLILFSFVCFCHSIFAVEIYAGPTSVQSCGIYQDRVDIFKYNLFLNLPYGLGSDPFDSK